MSVFVRKQLGLLRTECGNERGKFLVPWMEGVARRIPDPVARLRFLRIAAPFVKSGSTDSERRGIPRPIPLLWLWLAAMVCAIAIFAAGHGIFAAVAAGKLP
ncbi:MAG: hypothetical protein ABSB15_14610 [Bryobacteraceae bacterium]|jgi:hypothetical protein